MSVVDKTVKVSGETDAFMGYLVDAVAQISKAVKSGAPILQEASVVMSALLTDLVPALQKVHSLSDEEKENMGAFIRTCELRAEDLALAVLGQ